MRGPNDCIAMAIQQTAPICVSRDVWDRVEDMTDALGKMQQEDSHDLLQIGTRFTPRARCAISLPERYRTFRVLETGL